MAPTTPGQDSTPPSPPSLRHHYGRNDSALQEPNLAAPTIFHSIVAIIIRVFNSIFNLLNYMVRAKSSATYERQPITIINGLETHNDNDDCCGDSSQQGTLATAWTNVQTTKATEATLHVMPAANTSHRTLRIRSSTDYILTSPIARHRAANLDRSPSPTLRIRAVARRRQQKIPAATEEEQ